MNVTLLKTEKFFRVKRKIRNKTYMFNVKRIDMMNSKGSLRAFDIKRMKLHMEDCHDVLSKKMLAEIKADILKRLDD